jgi:hypothetical protein
VRERGEIGLGREPPGLEPTHLAARCGRSVEPLEKRNSHGSRALAPQGAATKAWFRRWLSGSAAPRGTVRNRAKKAAAIGEPVDLDGDPHAELARKAEKKATAADHKAARKAARHKDREKNEAPKPAHKNREKTRGAKPPRQPDLAVVIRDLNVAWSPAAIETAAARLTDAQKADFQHNLPDVIQKAPTPRREHRGQRRPGHLRPSAKSSR